MSTFIDCADNLACATLSGSNNINVNLQAGSPNKIVVSLSQSVVGLSKLEVTGNAIITDNSSNAALRITQTGAGEAIRVEDSANPDSTPFVVTTAGSVGIGTSSPGAELDIVGDGFINLDLRSAGASAGSYITLRRSQGTTSSRTILTNGDYVGGYLFSGYDGAVYRDVAAIYGVVDGIAGSNDMPGTMIFSTTADAAGTTTERMRINAAGNVGIGTASPLTKLEISGAHVSQQGLLKLNSSIGSTAAMTFYPENVYAGAIFFDTDDKMFFGTQTAKSVNIYTSGTSNTRLTIDDSGNVGIGTTSPAVKLHVVSDTTNWIRSQAGSSSAGGNGIPIFNCNKNRGTVGSPTAVVNGDELGRFDVRGYNNSDFRQAAQISAVCTATPGGSDTAIATSLYFRTSPGGTTVPADRMIINSAGNVGIATNGPDANSKLHVNGALAIVGTNTGYGFMQFGSSSTAVDNWHIGSEPSTDRFKIYNGSWGSGAEKVAIDTNGYITASGITFGSAGGTGTATGNLLSDYEEGTWTPTLKYGSNANSTITVTSAQYTKIGRTVTLGCEITVGAIVGSGQATLGGLPFAANSSTSAGGLFCIYFTGVSTVLNIVGKVTPSSSNILLYKTNAALATISNANNTELLTGSNVIFRIVYDT